MRTLLITFLCLLMVTGGKAQDTSIRSSPVLSSKILVAGNRACLVLRTKSDTVSYLLMDESMHVLARMDQPWKAPSDFFLSERAEFVGVPTYRDSVFHVYFTITPAKAPERLLEKVIDFGKRTVSEPQILLPSKDDVVLGLFQDGEDRLHVISSQTKTVQSYALDGDRTDWDIPSLNDPNGYFGYIRFVPMDGPQEIDLTTAKTLAYLKGNQLVLFTHVADHPLQMAIVRLLTGEVHVKELLMPSDSVTSPKHFQVASTLFADKIFQLRAYQDGQTELAVYQIPDLHLIRYYRWTKPLIQYDPLLGLAVNRSEDGNYLLTMGTYRDLINDRYGHALFHFGAYSKSSVLESIYPGAHVGLGQAIVANSVNNSHAKSQGPNLYTANARFNAHLAQVWLDGKSLDSLGGPPSLMGQTNVYSWEKAMSAFSIGGRQFTGSYENGAYRIREFSGPLRP